MKRARKGDGPTIIETITMRMRGHAEHDDFSYVPKSLLEHWQKMDPVDRYIAHCMAKKALKQSEIEDLRNEIIQSMRDAIDAVIDLPFPPAEEAFKNVFIEEYCNLSIYPLVGILEKEAGLLSDFVEAFNEENIATKYVIHGDHNLESIQFLKENLLKSNKQSQSDYKLTYIDDSIKKHNLLKITDIMLVKQNDYFDSKFSKIKKTKFNGRADLNRFVLATE